MTNIYIIDTDSIYASLINEDSNHSKALLQRGKIDGGEIYITDFVLGEAATLLSRRSSKATADGFLSSFGLGGFNLIIADKKLIGRAKFWFLKQKTKETSFVDCLNMAAAEKLKANAIISFDKVYEQNGFKLLK